MKVTNEIKKAIKEILKVRVDRANHGMLSTLKASYGALKLLDNENIDVFYGYDKHFNGSYNVVVKDDEIIAHIKPKHSSKKVNGMYKELQPTIEWL